MKKIKIKQVTVEAHPGESSTACIAACFPLVVEHDANVVLIHNDKKYSITTSLVDEFIERVFHPGVEVLSSQKGG